MTPYLREIIGCMARLNTMNGRVSGVELSLFSLNKI